MNKRIIYGIAAGVVALSLLVTGVWAWIDNAQHKSNIIKGGPDNIHQDVVLIEDFEEPEDPIPGDEWTKKISAKNTGEGDIFVRIQLKEYMEVSKQYYGYAEQPAGTLLYLLVDSDGKFVASAGPSAANRASFKLALDNMGLDYTDAQIVGPFTAYGDTVARYYLNTNGTTNLNGKNGKQLLVSFTQDAAKPFVTGAVKGTYENTTDNQLHKTAECNYAVHTWNGADHCDCGNGDAGQFHEYIKWHLGSDIILLSQWDGKAVAKWILDDSSPEGWAYWGEALKPGVETSRLMESIELLKQPDGPYYYALHVDMQAADIYQMRSNFTGMPAKIENVYRPIKGFYITAGKTTARGDDIVTFEAFFDGAAIPLSSVTWSVARKDGAANPFPYTQFANASNTPTPGKLTIGTLQDATVLVVTAEYTPTDGAKQTRTFEITIMPT